MLMTTDVYKRQDYSNAPTNINGVIRLDYAPVWMAAGLIFEKILSK